MFVRNKYQLLPPLDEKEYEALKADIEANGILIAVIVDEDGNILDGHHRAKICDELEIDYPREVRVGLDEAGKRSFARTVNIHRRHLSRAQRRGLIADELTENPTLPNLKIAQTLGVSDHTVAAVRKELGLDEVKVVGADGKEYTTQHVDRVPSVERYVYSLAFADEEGYKNWMETVRLVKRQYPHLLISVAITKILKRSMTPVVASPTTSET